MYKRKLEANENRKEKKNHKHKNNKIHILKMQVKDFCMCVVKESK
jgi:hypothetical protein